MRAYKKLKKIFYRYSIISDIDNILQWDLSTVMPELSRKNRAKQLTLLNEMKHEAISNLEIRELFNEVESEELIPDDYSNLREMKKQYLYLSALPLNIIRKKSMLSAECEGKWRLAKIKKNFNIVKNDLAKLFEVLKEESNILSDAYECSPYDALLKNYEYSFNSNEIQQLFDSLQLFINKIYSKIQIRQKKEGVIPIKENLTEEQQFELSIYFMRKIGFDFKRGRLDQSAHPFCGGGFEDVRITTRMNKNDSFSSFEAVMHETGHALYEQNLPRKWTHQPAGTSGGMALHESQSLFIEMQIMKSKAFQNYLSDTLRRKFNLKSNEWTSNNLYRIFNKVAKDYIRVEADEVTYPLHIIMRFNLEKKIIDTDINIKELPDLWNEEFKKVFKFDVDNDANGCLQDIHWYAGLLGYFPTYTLGALIASQFSYCMKKQILQMDEKIASGNFKEITKWLKKNIHSKGSLRSTKEILKDVTNSKLNVKFFKEYLTNKYIN